MGKLIVKNIGMLATPEGRDARRGHAQGEIRVLRDAYVLMEDGIIAEVGVGTPDGLDAEVIDAQGKLVTPGLVDAHTHLIFGGWRQNELGLKLHGATYLDILAMGGGASTKLTAPGGKVQRSFCPKYPKEYIEKIDEVCAKKQMIAAWYHETGEESLL